MGQTVKDPRVSKERGNPLGAKQDSLTVASDTAAKDLVGANGLPAAAIAVDVDNNGVKGTYWRLFGSLESGMKIKISWLWAVQEEDIRLWIQPGNLERYEFGEFSEARNVSKWIDAKRFCLTGLSKGDEALDWATVEGRFEAVKEGLSARLWIQVSKVGEVEVGMQIAPKSPEKLRLWGLEKNKNPNSLLTPAYSIWLGRSANNTPKKLVSLPMGLVETANDGFGLGHLPLFVVVGDAENAVYPTREELKRELFALQRGAQIPYQRRLTTGQVIENLMEGNWEGSSKYCEPRWPEGPKAVPGGVVGE